MEIRFLLLTAFLVSSEIPPIQPKIQLGMKVIANEVSADSKVQQNLRSLFDSLSKKEMMKTDNLRDLLEKEAVEEQRAFDSMKEYLRLSREKSAHRQRSLYANGDKGGDAAVFKRETDGNTGTPEAPVAGDPGAATQGPTADATEPTQTTIVASSEPEPVDEFIDYKPNILYNWKQVEKAYAEKDYKFLRFFCTRVHELAGWGRVKVINNFILDQSAIVYKNPAYHRTDTRFLQYVIQPAQFFEDSPMMDHFYITEGLEEDCIIYLVPTDRFKLNAFTVNNHVCGVGGALNGTMNARSEMPVCEAQPVEG